MVGLTVCLITLRVHAEIPDTTLEAIRAGFAARRDSMLHRQVTNPYPPIRLDSDDNLISWNRLDFALSALYLDVERADANRAVLDVVHRGIDQPNAAGEERFHWIAPLLIRIHGLFGAQSVYFPGRLTLEAEAGIRQLLWEYARERCDRTSYTPDRVWWCWGSENHDSQRVQSLWGAAKILSEDDSYRNRKFNDGHTSAEHFETLDLFVRERFRERIKKGLLAETASPTYSKYTLASWYNYHDFGRADTRRCADAALTIFWTDWAQEQFGTTRGGAKARVYQGEPAQKARADAANSMAWHYLGVGTPRNAHPGIMCMATSSYRMPLVVMDIALDESGRGTYTCRSRRPGLAQNAGQVLKPRTDGMDQLDPNCAGLVRYTYCTPAFIMGSWFVDKRPWTDWVGFSSQNRWQGVIFAGSDPDARIFPQCEGLRNGKTYNQYWSVQNRGTMIVAKLPGPKFSKQAGDMRVFFAPSLERREKDGWIFAESDRAYAAVGMLGDDVGYTWDNNHWARSRDSALPVIIEVCEKNQQDNFNAFMAAVLANRCVLDKNKLVYHGLDGSGTFAFFLSGDRLPEVNGKPIDLNPTKTFESPFLIQEDASGLITIRKESRRLTIDVSQQAHKTLPQDASS